MNRKSVKKFLTAAIALSLILQITQPRRADALYMAAGSGGFAFVPVLIAAAAVAGAGAVAGCVAGLPRRPGYRKHPAIRCATYAGWGLLIGSGVGLAILVIGGLILLPDSGGESMELTQLSPELKSKLTSLGFGQGDFEAYEDNRAELQAGIQDVVRIVNDRAMHTTTEVSEELAYQWSEEAWNSLQSDIDPRAREILRVQMEIAAEEALQAKN